MANELSYSSQMLLAMGQIIRENPLPLWEELPTIDLYMDQVVALMEQYVGFLFKGKSTDKAEAVISPSIVNNYVRLKILPPPVKKRYSRRHLAYLVMICMMKQTMSMASIRELIPFDADEGALSLFYNSFIGLYKGTAEYCIKEVEQQGHKYSYATCKEIAAACALVSNMAKMLGDFMLEAAAAEK